MSRKTGPSAGVAAGAQRQGAANYFSLAVKQAEEFSSFLTFLGTCENGKGVLHTSVYNCTSASGALPEWGKS